METFNIYKNNFKNDIQYIKQGLKKAPIKTSNYSTQNYINYLDSLNNLVLGNGIKGEEANE